MRPLASYLRALDPGLSGAVWLPQLGSFANAFGTGIVSAYLLIYLHDVRGISLGTAGLSVAAASPLGLWLVGAGLCVAGGLGALGLERGIPHEVRRTPSRVPLVEAAA